MGDMHKTNYGLPFKNCFIDYPICNMRCGSSKIYCETHNKQRDEDSFEELYQNIQIIDEKLRQISNRITTKNLTNKIN